MNETKICKDCGQELPISKFYTSKITKDGCYSYCKSCHNKRATVSTIGWKTRNPYENLIRNRWNSINQRTVNGKYTTSPSAVSCPQLKSYREKGIMLEMSFEGFRAWMLANETLHNEIVATGDKSSIDRIDDDLGYSLDNIALISLHSNIEKRVGKECKRTENKEEVKQYNKTAYIKSKK